MDNNQLRLRQAVAEKVFGFELQDKLTAKKKELADLQERNAALIRDNVLHPLDPLATGPGPAGLERCALLQKELDGEGGNAGLREITRRLEKENQVLREAYEGDERLLSRYTALEQANNELAARYKRLETEHQGEDGDRGLLSEHNTLIQRHEGLTARFNRLEVKYRGNDGKGGYIF
ncbi:hypothetical protein ACJQWK_04964 [Exserohilum turcicum]